MNKIVTGFMLVLTLVCSLCLIISIQPVKASGTIYIRADGSIDPSGANITTSDEVTYAFTGNISDSIVVERDNIVVDGAGYIMRALVGFEAISLSGRSNVTIKNMEIEAFHYGVYLDHSSGCNIVSGNMFIHNKYGVTLSLYSSNNRFFHNNFNNNTFQVGSEDSTNNVWDDGYPSGGNYWSDYAGVDVSPHDGIGDSPYFIVINNQDNYPLMCPYIAGDCNHDGIVNMTDADMVRDAWQSRIGDLNYNPHADLNMDGIISIKDATLVGLNWLKQA